jgi:ApaG protein
MHTMVTEITQGIKISVQSVYESAHSRPKQGYYVFSYRISIENKSNMTVQLLRRHWYIFDSIAGWNEVEGEGVVSQQPTLYPEDEYQYESFCPLLSEAGKMHGTYLMENKKDGSTFLVRIPKFELITPYRFN